MTSQDKSTSFRVFPKLLVFLLIKAGIENRLFRACEIYKYVRCVLDARSWLSFFLWYFSTFVSFYMAAEKITSRDIPEFSQD